MAKARVDIVCDCCGKTFSVEKNVRNTDAKLNYEEWVRKNVTTCYTCLTKQEIEDAVESGDAIIKRMLYKEYKANWPTCETVPDTYDAETKTVDVVIRKRDRAWHDAWEVIPAEKRNDKDFAQSWKWNFDTLLKQVPLTAPEGAPEWIVKVAEIINNIYA